MKKVQESMPIDIWSTTSPLYKANTFLNIYLTFYSKPKLQGIKIDIMQIYKKNVIYG